MGIFVFLTELVASGSIFTVISLEAASKYCTTWSWFNLRSVSSFHGDQRRKPDLTLLCKLVFDTASVVANI
jgi:hypothetical protein